MPGSKSGEVPHARHSNAPGHHADSDHAGRPVPPRHSIRRIKPLVDRAVTQFSPALDRMYTDHGRASTPPEHLLKASLMMELFSVRSERQFCERPEYDLLFNW